MKNFTIIVTLISAILSFNAKAQETEGENRLIDQNKIWEYVTLSRYGYPDNFSLDKYAFRGTTEINGKTYYNWTHLQTTKWNNEDWEVTVVDHDCISALMREDEDGKVYLLLDNGNYRIFPSESEGLSEPIEIIEPKEVLLYDFNAEVGENFDACVGLFIANPEGVINNVVSPCKVLQKEEVIVNDEESVKFTVFAPVYPYIMDNLDPDLNPSTNPSYIPDYENQTQVYYVKGIGNVGRGNMTVLCQNDELFTTTSNYYFYQTLNNVYNSSGDVIYKGKDYSAPTLGAIAEIESELPDTAIYDLFGRKVSNPLPGSIYIKGGKKFIGK